jgi:chaperonin GroEL (HSP60 family)
MYGPTSSFPPLAWSSSDFYSLFHFLIFVFQNVASISAGNDDSVGEMIADALDKVGSNGVLSIESSNSIDTFVEVTEGMEIDRGYISPQFVTNNERLLVEYDNCRVLVTDQKVGGGGVCCVEEGEG